MTSSNSIKKRKRCTNAVDAATRIQAGYRGQKTRRNVALIRLIYKNGRKMVQERHIREAEAEPGNVESVRPAYKNVLSDIRDATQRCIRVHKLLQGKGNSDSEDFNEMMKLLESEAQWALLYQSVSQVIFLSSLQNICRNRGFAKDDIPGGGTLLFDELMKSKAQSAQAKKVHRLQFQEALPRVKVRIDLAIKDQEERTGNANKDWLCAQALVHLLCSMEVGKAWEFCTAYADPNLEAAAPARSDQQKLSIAEKFQKAKRKLMSIGGLKNVSNKHQHDPDLDEVCNDLQNTEQKAEAFLSGIAQVGEALSVLGLDNQLIKQLHEIPGDNHDKFHRQDKKADTLDDLKQSSIMESRPGKSSSHFRGVTPSLDMQATRKTGLGLPLAAALHRWGRKGQSRACNPDPKSHAVLAGQGPIVSTTCSDHHCPSPELAGQAPLVSTTCSDHQGPTFLPSQELSGQVSTTCSDHQCSTFVPSTELAGQDRNASTSCSDDRCTTFLPSIPDACAEERLVSPSGSVKSSDQSESLKETNQQLGLYEQMRRSYEKRSPARHGWKTSTGIWMSDWKTSTGISKSDMQPANANEGVGMDEVQGPSAFLEDREHLAPSETCAARPEPGVHLSILPCRDKQGGDFPGKLGARPAISFHDASQAVKSPIDADIQMARRYHNALSKILPHTSRHKVQAALADSGFGTLYFAIGLHFAFQSGDPQMAARDDSGKRLYKWLFPAPQDADALPETWTIAAKKENLRRGRAGWRAIGQDADALRKTWTNATKQRAEAFHQGVQSKNGPCSAANVTRREAAVVRSKPPKVISRDEDVRPRAGTAYVIEQLGEWAENELVQVHMMQSTSPVKLQIPCLTHSHVDQSCELHWSVKKRLMRPKIV